MQQNQLPIAVFDSGVGGISVLRELVALMPQEHFLYFGDSANAPYGSRTSHEVQQLSLAVARSLFERGAKALVVACNTATAASIELLRQQWPEKIIVGIEPALKLALQRHPGGRVAVMATEVTIRERKFREQMELLRDQGQILPLACPGIVELVEAGRCDGPEMEDLIRRLLTPILSEKLDAVVLGCTHFPFVQEALRRVVGPEPEILDGGPGTARQTRCRLEQEGLLRCDGEGSVTFENSTGSARMLALCARLLEK